MGGIVFPRTGGTLVKKSVTVTFGQAFLWIAAAAIATTAGLAYGAGWVSAATLKKEIATHVDAALVQVCAERVIAKPGAVEALAKTQSYNRRSVLLEQMPKVGPASMDNTFTNACLEAVTKLQTAAK